MLRIIIFIITTSLSLAIAAEDVIVFRNGEVVRGIVREINQNEVKYQKSSNANGPLYTVDKTTLLSISYENGETEIFESASPKKDDNGLSSQSTDYSCSMIELTSSSENDSIIALYQNCRWKKEKNTKGKLKFRKGDEVFWALANGTILCNEDFEITFESEMVYVNEYHPYSNRIRFRNRGGIPLYIDLANSFRVKEGEATPFYDPNSYSSGGNKGNGISLGLGAVASVLGIGGPIGTLANGIGVSSGKEASSSATFTMNRILAVPPFSSVLLPGSKALYGNKILTYYEAIPDNYGDELQENDEVIYNGSAYLSKGMKQGFYITYSKSADFNKYKIIPIIMFPWRISTGSWTIEEGRNWRLIRGNTFNWNTGSFSDSENWDYKKNRPK